MRDIITEILELFNKYKDQKCDDVPCSTIDCEQCPIHHYSRYLAPPGGRNKNLEQLSEDEDV